MLLQPNTAAVPPAYIQNISQVRNATSVIGSLFQDSLSNTTHTRLDIAPNSRDRNRAGIAPLLNILLHMQYPTGISVSRTAVLSPWSTAAPSPIKRFEAGNEVVNNRLYLFGGYISRYMNNSIQATTRSDVYNPATNRWTQLANMPQPITHAGVAVDGNTIYIAGGYVGDEPNRSTANVFKYDVTRNRWSRGPSLPAPRGAGGLVRLGRELHFFGGINYDKTADNGDHWVFNLDGGTSWVRKAPLPNPRNHFGYTVDGNKIYAIGGQHLLDETHGNQSEVDAYNPLTNTWRRVASLPIARSHTHTSTFVRNGKIIIIGGQANGDSRPRTITDVTEYDPRSNRWVALPALPDQRQAAVAKLINNQIIVTTGAARGTNPQDTTWIGGGSTHKTVSTD